MIEITDFRDRLLLTLRAVPMGEDFSVALYGGGRAHVGAVALALPRPSLADPLAGSATASVLAAPGHKEDLLARELALKLASELGVTVAVACGIHLDAATETEIREVRSLALEMAESLTAEIRLLRQPSSRAPGEP